MDPLQSLQPQVLHNYLNCIIVALFLQVAFDLCLAIFLAYLAISWLAHMNLPVAYSKLDSHRNHFRHFGFQILNHLIDSRCYRSHQQ